MTKSKIVPNLGGKRAPRPQNELASYGHALDFNLPKQNTELRQNTSNSLDLNTPRKNPKPSLKNGVAVIQNTLKNLPNSPGCYRMLNANGDAIYIGMARNLKNRVAAYTKPHQQTNRIARMISLVHHMEIIETETEVQALLLETNLIKRLEPKFNVLLRDDKSYPYILIAKNHPFPRLSRHRGTQNIQGHYFGPFANVSAVRNSLAALERAFLLRSCSDNVFNNRTRPCLLYDLKRCTAPCVGKISQTQYDKLVRQARQTLNGNDNNIRAQLNQNMQHASDSQDFETAARLRDRLRALATISADQAINLSQNDNADLFACAQSGTRTCIQVFFFRGGRNYGNRAFFPRGCEELSKNQILSNFIALFYAKAPPPQLILASHMPNDTDLIENALSMRAQHVVSLRVPERGAKKQAMEHAVHNARAALSRRLAGENSEPLLAQIAEMLNVDELLERIEVFDNSHLRGSFPYGAMIVANPDGFQRTAYRKFRIQNTTQTEDDFAMMREVLTRRLAHLNQNNNSENAHGLNQAPDLWILDGGKGQLSVAQDVLQGRTTPALLAVAKGPKRNAGEERIFIPNQAKPISLPHNSPLLHYIQRLRDEAHRFAIGAHRKGRNKAQLRSRLDDVPGIGNKRRQALLHHFGDLRAISRASVKDLTRVPGVSNALAQQIHNSLKD